VYSQAMQWSIGVLF